MRITYQVFEIPCFSWEIEERTFSAKFVSGNWGSEKEAEDYINTLLETEDFKKSKFIIHKIYSNY